MKFINAWLFCPKVSKRNKKSFSLLFKTQCFWDVFAFWNINNFSLNNLLHCIQTCYILKCHKFLHVENFVVSRFFSKLVKFNSREIYWRQSNVKINSAIILVLKDPSIRNLSITFIFCSKKRHITLYKIHLVLISWCFHCFVVRMITIWLFKIKSLLLLLHISHKNKIVGSMSTSCRKVV